MNKLVNKVITLLAIGLCISGCQNVDNKSNDVENSVSSISGTSSVTRDFTNAMVVYFSATNNTKRVATSISNIISSPIYELKPTEPYTSADLNYNNSSSRVSQEHNNENRHVELENVTFEGFDEAKYIFLGAPVWWQELSWVINDFVSQNDFTNKTIITFGTSASSGFSINNLKTLAPKATWTSPKRFSSSASNNEITNWINGLNL